MAFIVKCKLNIFTVDPNKTVWFKFSIEREYINIFCIYFFFL